MATPVAVVVGETLPHGAGLQETVQLTMGVAEGSFITVAMNIAELPAITVALGGATVTEMGGGVMVMVAETDFVLLAVEVAVTVTVLGVGTAAGAVYVVALPLAV